MAELMILYACFSLAVLPSSSSGFMPFQDNYWLWKCIGFGGLGVFQARWIVQWLYSEAHKESKMPLAFWWLSLGGSAMELCYFLRQQDSVGVLGCMGGLTYVRNLVLIYKKRQRDALAVTQGIEIGRIVSNRADSSSDDSNGSNGHSN